MLTARSFDIIMLTGLGLLIAAFGLLFTLVTEGTALQNYVAHSYGIAFIAVGLLLASAPFARGRAASVLLVLLMLLFVVSGTEATLVAGNLYNEQHGSAIRVPTLSSALGITIG